MAWNVNSDLVKGNNMFLYIALPNQQGVISSATSKVMAYASTCSLQIDAETLDVTSKLSCRWNAVMQGNASYTVSSDNLYCLQSNAAANSAYTVDDLFQAMKDGLNVGWWMGQDSSQVCGTVAGLDTTKPYYYGEAAITSLSIEAGNNEICSSSITLTGSGAVNKGPVQG